MTIAELLVQTTATLYAVETIQSDGDGNPFSRPVYGSARSALADAKTIVAEIYGEPCVNHFSIGYGNEHDRRASGDPCVTCAWPRSQHTAQP